MAEEGKVKSLEKALNILECFNEENPELGITQISQMLGLNKSNVYSIISTFESRGYIEKNPVSGKYKLGMNLLRFSFMINENLGYQRIAYDIMREVSNELNAVTYFAIPYGGRVFYLCSAYPDTKDYDMPFRTIVGAVAPFYCTSLGKAMLAFMEEEEAQIYMKEPKIRFTANTICDEQVLAREIILTRERGYSIDNCEHENGVKCVGVPVLGKQGKLFGAISVSGSVATVKDDVLLHSSNVLKEAAFRIKERL